MVILWNYRQCHYFRLPSPTAEKTRTTLASLAQGRKGAERTRALHYDYDYKDHRQRENENYATTGGKRDNYDRSCCYYGTSSYVWQSSLQSEGGKETDYDYCHRRLQGSKRREPLRYYDEDDCNGHNHAGSTTGEVSRHENNDIVRLHHQTDWQTATVAIKITCVFSTW